jgi:hypothetical protein
MILIIFKGTLNDTHSIRVNENGLGVEATGATGC